MNENIDLTKILKDCTKGFKLYSSIFGDVYFQRINSSRIEVVTTHDKVVIYRINGEYPTLTEYGNTECTLFPSKDQKDWNKFVVPWYKKEKFDPKTLNPFDKVLVRDNINNPWICDHFSYINHANICITTDRCKYCIPYNEETKHLVGTTKEAPEYYRYWE